MGKAIPEEIAEFSDVLVDLYSDSECIPKGTLCSRQLQISVQIYQHVTMNKSTNPRLLFMLSSFVIASPLVFALGVVNYHAYISEQHIECVQAHNLSTHEIHIFKTAAADFPVCVQKKPYTNITSK